MIATSAHMLKVCMPADRYERVLRTKIAACCCRIRLEEEAVIAAAAAEAAAVEAEAAQLAEEASVTVAEAEAVIDTLAADSGAQPGPPEPNALSTARDEADEATPLLSADADEDASSVAPSGEAEIASTTVPAASLLDSLDDVDDSVSGAISAAESPAEAPKPVINAWAKPLIQANGPSASTWQVSSEPTPAEAAQHKAQTTAYAANGLASGQTSRQAVQDATPGSWDELINEPSTQPTAPPGRGRHSQASWRQGPQHGQGYEPIPDGLGNAMGDRHRGRGHGRGRGRHQEGEPSRRPLQEQGPEGERPTGERFDRGRGRNARGRGRYSTAAMHTVSSVALISVMLASWSLQCCGRLFWLLVWACWSACKQMLYYVDISLPWCSTSCAGKMTLDIMLYDADSVLA